MCLHRWLVLRVYGRFLELNCDDTRVLYSQSFRLLLSSSVHKSYRKRVSCNGFNTNSAKIFFEIGGSFFEMDIFFSLRVDVMLLMLVIQLSFKQNIFVFR